MCWCRKWRVALQEVPNSEPGSSTHVNHNGLLAERAEGHSGVDSTPIEFDGATDAVDTASKHDDTVVVEGDIMRRGIVRGVEVVSIYTYDVSISRTEVRIPKDPYQRGIRRPMCRSS
jgi:hypothetical protein